MANRLCLECKKSPRKPHGNAKYCDPCAEHLKSKGSASTVTKSQAKEIKRLAGKMYIHDLAAKVGLSKPTLVRFARREGISLNAHKYKDEVIAEVTAYYEKYGKIATQKKFPTIKVRSIVERYNKGRKPRQVRWTDEQLVDLIRMAGLVSFERQAKFFDRPNANEGSIKSAWSKKFGYSGSQLHGLSKWHAVRLAPRCRLVTTDFWVIKGKKARQIALWVDLRKSLCKDTPKEIHRLVGILAKYQNWLFRGKAWYNINKLLERSSL